MSFTHSNWLPQFGLDDLFYDYLTYRQYFDDIGGSFTQLQHTKFNDKF